MTQTTSGEVQFVNDWSELERAVEVLAGHALYTDDYGPAMATVVEYVPRLLTQYASLLELSLTLTEGWEQYASLQAPTGLYLPDHG